MNLKQVNETTSYGAALISRLLTFYLDGAMLLDSDKPMIETEPAASCGTSVPADRRVSRGFRPRQPGWQ